jgi:adenosine deaminase
VGSCAPPTSEHRRRLTQNGFRASFLPEEDKARHLAAVAASQP